MLTLPRQTETAWARPLVFAAAALSTALWAYACGDGATEPPPPTPDPPRATSLTVTPSTAQLAALGSTVQLAAEVRDQNGNVMGGAAVSWSSGDASVATVDGSGLVTAAGNGTATITATSGQASGTASVTVAQVVSAVTVTPAADTLLQGDTLRLSAEAADANGHAVAGAAFTWASSDTLVAVVDDSGLVAGVGAGPVTISATSSGVTGSAELAVVAPAPTTVDVTPDTVAFMAIGHTAQLAAAVLDQAGRAMEDVAVSWSSADTMVAVVDSAGLVTAVGAGATTVTATAGEASGEAVVNVMQSTGSVTVSPPADTIAPGDTLRLVAQAYDENGHLVDGAEFTWSSSDVPVATVDGSGLVRGRGEGTATITATSGSAEGTTQITVANPDRAALVALYNATDGPNWVNNENWLTDVPLGEWYGVSTNAAGRVVELRLAGRYYHETREHVSHGLAGEIPPELGDLANLTRLELWNNALTGPIPPELGDLANLQFLHLAVNHLTGPIPPELSSLSKLRHLHLGSNNLTGEIPPELGNLANLEQLILFSNALSGAIPPELSSLSKLRQLRLISNNLTGEIPPELGELEELRRLELNVNNLSGPIPPELGDLANLTDLWLHSNALSGAIPPELGGLKELRWLILWGNDLTGEIPPELGGLSNLEYLSLANSRLSGPIPPKLGDLQKLVGLILGDSDLSGPIPPELGNLENLENLGLGGNELGAFPQTFLNLRNLRNASVQCSPTGVCVPGTSEFVAWTKGLADADELAFCNAPDQAVLTSFYKLAAGGEWAESGGWLGGPALEEWHGVETDSLGRVTGLVLSDNGLSGSLPGVITDLGQLASLRIDGNELSGRLPLMLTALDLDEFHYDGTDLCEPADAKFRDWLDGIPSHRGTAVQCAPLTDRDALVALYEGTDGPTLDEQQWLAHRGPAPALVRGEGGRPGPRGRAGPFLERPFRRDSPGAGRPVESGAAGPFLQRPIGPDPVLAG